MAVVKIIELIGTSSKSSDDAVQQALKEARTSLRNIKAIDLVSTYQRTGSSNAALKDAVDLLKNWNGQMEKDSPAAMLVNMVYLELRKAAALAGPDLVLGTRHGEGQRP